MSKSAQSAALKAQVLRGMEFAAQFVLAVIAARSAGPTEYGTIGLLTSIQMFVMVILVFGFDELTQRELARGTRSPAVVVRVAVTARVVTCAAAAVAGFGAAGISAAAGNADMALSLLWMTAATTCALASNFFVNVGLATFNVAVPLAASLLSWVVPLAAVAAFGADSAAEYFLFVFVGAALRIAVSFAWYFSQRRNRQTHDTSVPRRGRLLSTFQEHAALTLNLLTTQVLGRYGDVIVAAALFLPLGAIATYSLAFQITSTTNTFLMIGLGAIGLTQFSSASSDPSRLGQRWHKFSRLAALVSFGPFAMLALLSPVVLPQLFGAEYSSIVGLTMALLGAQWINRVCGGGTNIGALIALGKSKSVALSSAAGAIVNVAGNFMLIPAMGAYGMAVATGASVATVGVWNTLTVRNITGTPPPWRYLAVLTLILLAIVAASLSSIGIHIRLALVLIVAAPWTFFSARAWAGKETWS